VAFKSASLPTLPVESDVVYDTVNQGSGYVLSASSTGNSGSLLIANITGTFGGALEKLELVSMLRFKEQSGSFVQNMILSNSLTPTASGTLVRYEQIGGDVGRVYLSDVFGTWANDDPIYSSTTRLATASGTLNVAGTWIASGSTVSNADTVNRDIGDGNGVQPYDAVVECSGATLLQTYERFKYLTRDVSTDLVDTVEGRLYISANTSSYAPSKTSPLGTFAGGTLFAARGIFVQNMAASDVRNYQLIDSNGITRNPPNLQNIVVNSLVAGDRVAVFPRSGSTSEIFKNQYEATGDASGSTTLTVAETIWTETPSAGVVRHIDKSYNYSSFNGSTFIIDAGHDGTTAGDDVYVPYIEEQAAGTEVSVSVVHTTDRTIKTRVRRKGILPFEVDGTFGSTGVTVSAIRTTDSIVD
jgi:hypothetical protein